MALSKQEIKRNLIERGVSNLKEFGYPKVNTLNITKDVVFRLFFIRMLKENLTGSNESVKECIVELITDLNEMEEL